MVEGDSLPLKTGKPKFFYGYIIASVAFFIIMVVYGTMYTFGVFFKPLVAEFGWTRAMTSSAYALFMFLHGLLYIVTGRLNDRFGPRVLVAVCSLFLGLGYFLMSQISTIWHLYLFYGVIVAVGVSGAYVPLVSTVARWFVKRRGMMTGAVVAGVGVGTMIMPPIAEWLISTYGWRTSFTIMGIVVSVFTISAAQFLRRHPSQVGQQPDGADEVREDSLNWEAGGFSFQRAIQTRQFWMLFGVFLCFNLIVQSIIVHIVPHITDLGISAIVAASALTTIGGLSIGGRIVMGSVADRIGDKPTMVFGFILMSATLLWLLVAKEMWMLYLFAAVFGFAYGSIIPLGSTMIAELFGLSSHGVILGVVSFGAAIGGAIGPVMAGLIYDITDSYQLAFLIYAGVAIVAIILVSLLRLTSDKGGGK